MKKAGWVSRPKVILKLKRVWTKRIRKKKDWKTLGTNDTMWEIFHLSLRNRYQPLEQETFVEETDVGAEWEVLTVALKTAACITVPDKRRRGRQRWMREEILGKMEVRRKLTSLNLEKCGHVDQETEKKELTLEKNIDFSHKSVLKFKG